MKKLRCIKSEGADTRCESCVHANISCEYRDREQYLAERNRMVKVTSPPSSGSSTPTGSANLTLNYDSRKQGHSIQPIHSSSSLQLPSVTGPSLLNTCLQFETVYTPAPGRSLP